jgi:hypothetical protein
MQIKAAEAGLRIVEVPASYRRRTGASKITGTVAGTARASAKILWTIFRMAVTRERRTYTRERRTPPDVASASPSEARPSSASP